MKNNNPQQSSERTENDAVSKAKKVEPKFLRIKLSESETSLESENEEKAERRRKKLEDERKLAKQKRRILQSGRQSEDLVREAVNSPKLRR